jgi:release factor glutamine methyltransferase
MAGTCIGEALLQAGRELAPVSETASSDVQVLLAEMLGRPRAWLLAHCEAAIPHEIDLQFRTAVERLVAGEPLPYLLGEWEFYGRRFLVAPDVLIPRPETELLVEAGLRAIDEQERVRKVIDIGTGSGCVGITLALERPQASVIATDISRAALLVARENAKRLGVRERMAFVEADLTAGLSLDDTILVANLPYVASADVRSLRCEPRLALDGGMDGLGLILRLLQQLADRRPQRTTVLLEIGAGQGSRVADLTLALCNPSRVWQRPDLAGHDRIFGFGL